MSAEELLTPAAGNQVEENTKEQSKEVETEDKKGLMDEIMEVISRGSASEEERQSTPSAVERPPEEEHQIDDANEEVKKSSEEELTETKDDDTSATQEAREPPPAEEEARAAGEEGEKISAQADTAASTDAANAGEAPVAAEEEPKDEPKVEDGEGEPSADKAVEPEDVATPPVDVTVSYLISTEDALAKGIAEEDVERFKQYHLKSRFGVQSWYQSLKEHTFETEFINLTKKQVEVLAAAAHPFSDAPELSEEQREVLSKLEEEIDAALEKFGDAGAFIKLDTCSGKDSVLDRNDADHIQEIKDGVVNEMEIEKQFANAYLIWRSWRSSSFRRSSTSNSSEAQEGRLRRSFRRIQKSFNRPRAQTTSLQATPAASKENDKAPKNEDALAEETPKKEEEKEEEVKEDKPETEADKSGDSKDEGETKKEEEEGAKSGEEPAAAVTVEATIETEVEPKETDTTVEQKVDEEDNKEEISPPAQEDVPAVDDDDSEKKKEVATAAEPKEENETEIEVQEEGKEEAKVEEKEVKEVEETPVKKSEKKDKKENAKEKKKPRSVKDKGNPVSEEHTSVKVKEEPTQNKVLRALMRATTEKYHVTSGKQAVQMLLTSARVKEELTLMHTFGEHLEDYQVVLCVRRWNDQVPRYPGMQFRGFVHKKRLTALSQYDDMVYIPNIIRFKSTIQKKILSFFNAHVKRAIQDHDNYLIDIFVAPNQVYLIKLSPFHTSSGACLFTWREHKELLTTTSRSIKFFVVPSPKPNCFSGLQSWWQSPLENIVQEHKKIEEPEHGQRCSIL